MWHAAELLFYVIVTFCVEMTPERPVWLRRLVQAFWILLALLMVLAWGYGLVLLVQAV